uniref:Uncharacterized protein n=1 Tax=Echinococcus canadensis TaxID=519352 RepID=A0A915EXS7_9CEST
MSCSSPNLPTMPLTSRGNSHSAICPCGHTLLNFAPPPPLQPPLDSGSCTKSDVDSSAIFSLGSKLTLIFSASGKTDINMLLHVFYMFASANAQTDDWKLVDASPCLPRPTRQLSFSDFAVTRVQEHRQRHLFCNDCIPGPLIPRLDAKALLLSFGTDEVETAAGFQLKFQFLQSHDIIRGLKACHPLNSSETECAKQLSNIWNPKHLLIVHILDLCASDAANTFEFEGALYSLGYPFAKPSGMNCVWKPSVSQSAQGILYHFTKLSAVRSFEGESQKCSDSNKSARVSLICVLNLRFRFRHRRVRYKPHFSHNKVRLYFPPPPTSRRISEKISTSRWYGKLIVIIEAGGRVCSDMYNVSSVETEDGEKSWRLYHPGKVVFAQDVPFPTLVFLSTRTDGNANKEVTNEPICLLVTQPKSESGSGRIEFVLPAYPALHPPGLHHIYTLCVQPNQQTKMEILDLSLPSQTTLFIYASRPWYSDDDHWILDKLLGCGYCQKWALVSVTFGLMTQTPSTYDVEVCNFTIRSERKCEGDQSTGNGRELPNFYYSMTFLPSHRCTFLLLERLEWQRVKTNRVAFGILHLLPINLDEKK